MKQNKTSPPDQRYIKQLLFIVPTHQWLYSAFPVCQGPGNHYSLGFPTSPTWIYFLFSTHVIRYIFWGFSILLLVFFFLKPWCYFWDNGSLLPMAINFVFAGETLYTVSSLCFLSLGVWKQSQSPRVALEPDYSKLITFRKSTQEGYRQQPLQSPSVTATLHLTSVGYK